VFGLLRDLLAPMIVGGFRLPRRAREAASSEQKRHQQGAIDTEPTLAAA
jgi:hypothetical protein